MNEWTPAMATACLWLVAACLAVGWLAGLVAEYQDRMQWSHTEPVYKVHKKCPRLDSAAFCQ